MQFAYVKDVVELAVKVVEQRNAVGHAFNTANARAITQNELLHELATVAGIKEPQIVSVPRDLIHRAGGQAMGDQKLYFGQYYDLPAITQIITKAQRMLGFKPTEFAVGLKETYRAYLKDHRFPEPDFSFEDALLRRSSSPTVRSA
jgi:nucleoside-diphosphate-sugar epimerase